MKTELIKCDQCRADMDPLKVGSIAAIVYGPKAGPLLFCSKKCKREYAGNVRPPGSANAEKGVKISGVKKREPSRAEILKKIRPKETNISRAIGKHLDDAGIWNTRTQSGQVKTVGGGFMKLCKPGTPDRIFAAGLPVWIEVKRPGEVATPEQLKIHQELRDNGCLVFVLDDAADLDFILHGLKSYSETIEDIVRDVGIIYLDILHDIETNRAARTK